MKYKVIGWVYREDTPWIEGENTYAARQAIVDDIKKNGYVFTGFHHNLDSCVPVLNDGKKRIFYEQDFATILAEAYGEYDLLGPDKYSIYNIDLEYNLPPYEDIDTSKILPLQDLTESIEINIDEENYKKVLNNQSITLNLNSAPKYLDKGDELVCHFNENTIKKTVAQVEVYQDISTDDKFTLMFFTYSSDIKEREKANEKWKTFPFKMVITFKND